MAAPDSPSMLRNLWYYALPGAALPRGQMVARTILGEPMLFARDAAGQVFALLDVCPHRGMPLTEGSFDGREVECCYHGWRFDRGGRCTAIPWLVDGQEVDVQRIKVRRFPAREHLGNVWVHAGAPDADEAALPELPPLPDIGVPDPNLAVEMDFACHIDQAVIGLMDPAHGPFVHTSWWWRPNRSMQVKEKAFEPAPLGFRMKRHQPASNSRAYYLFLGGQPETEITFRLPGVRVEQIRAGRHQVVQMTAVTPIDEATTRISHVIYWTVPWLSALKPALRRIAHRFIDQDRMIVEKQQRGLKHRQPMMLVKDADTLARWYFGLKKEFAQAESEGREFRNPVPETVLRWRS
ncbi:MAG: aromatic ring-hydroxylating dioxygenase subunit alpha [Alphaproteobacteria bacterium]|nr:aromatic ring-hydroxylating dioxygenase subunit alpha [Alphaproteobacteria bacterium]